MNNILTLIKYNIRITRKTIIGWITIISSITFMYMILFPYIKDLATIKLNAMPKELLQLFKMDDFVSLGNYNDYYATMFNIILIIASVFGCIYIGSIFNNEEKNKSIEFIYSLPITRSQIFIAKLITTTIVITINIICFTIAAIICGFLVGKETFNLIQLLEATKASSLAIYFHSSISILIAGITIKYSSSLIGAIFVIFSYIIGYLSTLLKDKGEILSYFSPLETLSPKNIINQDSILFDPKIMTIMIVYTIIMFILIYISYIYYKKRDLGN